MQITTRNGLLFLNAYKDVLDVHEGIGTQKNIDEAIDTINNIVKDPGPIDGSKRDGVALVTSIILIAKETPAIWELLDNETKQKCTDIMRCAGYVYSYMVTSTSDVTTGFDFKGNYNKRWQGNYALSYVSVIINCVTYFGGYETFDQLLLDFDYDRELALYKSYKWDGLVESWTAAPPTKQDGTSAPDMRQLTMFGGIPYADVAGNVTKAGHTEGVRRPLGMKADGSQAPVRLLVDRCVETCCDKIPVVSSIDIDEDSEIDAKMFDDTISPFEGQIGMFKELNAGDYSGFRSDLGHCAIDFNLITLVMSNAFALQLDPWNPNVWDRLLVGCGDFLYKAEHGWIGRCLGNRSIKHPGEMLGFVTRNGALELWNRIKGRLENREHWPKV